MKRPRFTTTTTSANGIQITTSKEYASGDEGEEDDPEVQEAFDNARVEPVAFSTIMDKHAPPTTRCWGCIYRFEKQRIRGKNKAMDLLYETYDDNRNTMCERDLAQLISDIYDKVIRVPEIQNGNEDVLEWTPEQVYIHLKFHDLNIQRGLERSLRHVAFMEEEYLNCQFNGGDQAGGKTVVNKEMHKMLMDVITKKKELSLAIRQLQNQ